MIEVGTKLKSTRSGEIIEVLVKTPENMKVRLADGSEKTLSASTIARWYDEVKETPAKKQAKKVSTEASTQKKPIAKKEPAKAKVKPVGQILKEVAKPKAKKENAEHAMAAELAGQLKTHVEKAGWTFLVKKEYTAIVNKAEKHLAHVWMQKSKVKFSFKKTTLANDDKKWMVELPAHFRCSYNYQVDVTDPTLMKRCLDLLDRING